MIRFLEGRRIAWASFLMLAFFVACAPLPQDPGWPGVLHVPGSGDAEASLIVVYTNQVHRVDAQTGEPVLLPPALRAVQDDDFNWRVESCANKGNETQFADNWKAEYFSAPVLAADGQSLYLASFEASGGDEAIQWALLASGEVDFGDCLPLAAGVLADLVRDGDTLYIAQLDGRLQARDLADEFALRWQFAAGDDVWATPLILREAPLCHLDSGASGAAVMPLEQPLLILASLDHHLYALDPETGAEIWRRDLGGTVASPPLACWRGEQLRLYVGSFASRVHALDAANGELLHEYRTQNWVWGQPAVDEVGRLYVADLRGNVYQLDLELREIWQQKIADEGIRAAPHLLGERLLVAARDGQIYLLYTDDGTVSFHEDLGRQVLTDILVIEEAAGGNPLVVFATTRKSELLRAFQLDGDRLRPLWVYDGG
ncbi:MAG: PQQ-binding-like beta-propeller repeat protein [Anaerolineaceae bacterium]|nr:PQQ-binding-like beta-propeller repeat protein [Anaerolineaceae bacterium]